jgi:transposase
MPAAVKLRTDYLALDLRRLAAGSRHANQSRRLLSLAAVLDGMDREQAARIGGMDRQTLRDWVHRFNEHGPEGLKDIRSKGHPPRLSADQLAALATLVETGPDRAVDGVVRWRRIDLKRVIEERFGVDYHERTIGKLPKQIGFSHISARPHHPAQDERVIGGAWGLVFAGAGHAVRLWDPDPASRVASARSAVAPVSAGAPNSVFAALPASRILTRASINPRSETLGRRMAVQPPASPSPRIVTDSTLWPSM